MRIVRPSQSSGNPNSPAVVADLRVGADGEPRIQDLGLAHRFGYANPRDLRKLTRRLISNGSLFAAEVYSEPGRRSGKVGRPPIEYWLTEEQALFVAARSDVEVSAIAIRELIKAFTLARRSAIVSTERVGPSGCAGEVFEEKLADARESIGEILSETKPLAPEHAHRSPEFERIHAMTLNALDALSAIGEIGLNMRDALRKLEALDMREAVDGVVLDVPEALRKLSH